MKYDLRNLSFNELEKLITGLNMEPYNAKQIYQWVFQKNVNCIEAMTNISKKNRAKLDEAAFISRMKLKKSNISNDSSIKFIFVTADGYGVESVLIPEKNHFTICISTQIGCSMRCRFCCTGINGLVRNLSTAEILSQVITILKAEAFEKLPNIVFMGMGEPLLNYDNLVKSIRILLDPNGFNFSHRKITVSTAGLIPQIKQLGADLPVNLAISLNAPNDTIRNFLMPVNRKFPINDLIKAAEKFPIPSRKRITFEYVLLRDINDSTQNALELGKLLNEIPCKINLIPFNEHSGSDLKTPVKKRIIEFQSILHNMYFTAPIRRSKGSDISAACGQLGGKRK